MIYFDGIYRLERQARRRSLQNSKTACAWRIRLIDFRLGQSSLKYLRPLALVASQTGEGIFRTNCAESMGQRICRDFDLDIRKLLWVENFSDDPQRLFVAQFRPRSFLAPGFFYAVSWRSIRSNELATIRDFIPELTREPGV